MRKFACKRLLAMYRGAVLAATADMRQYVCVVPGGADAIIHFRKSLMGLWHRGKLSEPLCIIDIDQKNFFGSLEWESIRSEVCDAFPRRGAALARKHAEATAVHRGGAPHYAANRGTGQGDVDATMEASLVQGRVAKKARQDIYEQMRASSGVLTPEEQADVDSFCRDAEDYSAQSSDPQQSVAGRSEARQMPHPGNRIVIGTRVFDVWYLDDGTIVLNPVLAVPFLEAFDRRSVEVGAERNRQKTKVSMLLPETEAAEHSERWQLERLRDLADVSFEPQSLETLGAETASTSAIVRHFREKTRVADTMLKRIPLCQNAQVELVLQRACLGVSKVNHLLRANGAELAEEKTALRAFDAVQEQGLRRLVPGLTESGREQAMRAPSLGGVGLVSAERHAAAANLASIATAWPMVQDLADAGGAAGLFSASDLMEELGRSRDRALRLVREQLEEDDLPRLDDLLERVSERAGRDWRALRTDTPAASEHAPRARRGQQDSRGVESAAVGAARAALDSGHLRAEPDHFGGVANPTVLSSFHVQREVSLLVETAALARFISRLEADDDRGARRLAELLDGQTCHDWLWKINPRDGSRLGEEDFLLALSSRLGATQVEADAVCRQCGEPLDSAVAHALCCAPAESTKGHYAVVGAVADGISLADPALQTEVRGLVPTTDRPADILTTGAIPGTNVALDITIASQDAIHAGLDACISAYRRKMTRYSTILPALRRAGVIFQPMVWSAEGRPHPAAVRIMDCTVRMVRTRRGVEAASELSKRWRHEIAIAIQRRKAAMIRAALPGRSQRCEWLARGGRATEDGDTQLPPLEEDEEEEGDKEAVEAESPQADEAAMEP